MKQTYIPENTIEIDEEQELTAEEKGAQLLENEDDILAALMSAANFREDEIATVDIDRGGKHILTFRIRPLAEDEYNRCREKCTRYVRNKGYGVRVPQKTDSSRYRSMLIYEATIDEDRERLWQNKAAWKKLNVLNGIDLISRVLMAGEKDRVCEVLDKISGYENEEIEAIKN